MRILITNNTLDGRGGSEMYVRDLALALLRRGHQPVCYSTRLGDVAHELRTATVPVIDHLDQLAIAPDVIHGQHHLDAMTAMLHFPQTPAIYFCHGWLPWEEMPPKFPTIRRYVAVDDLCAERLQCEHGIAAESISVIRNFVDLRRSQLRASLPVQPRRALVFSNAVREDGYLPVIRQACAQRRIALDAIGAAMQRTEATPERILGGYDIVFAKARSAIEAMASGCAVIVCDAVGLAGMVTAENYPTWRNLNFGVRTLNRPITVDNVVGELDRYNAAQAAAVTARIRTEADMEPVIDAIVALYAQAIADRDRVAATKASDIAAAASEYLRQIAIEVKARHEPERLRAQASAETTTQRLRAERAERLHSAGGRDSQAGRQLLSERHAATQLQQVLMSMQEQARTRAENIHGILKTPFWQLLGRAYSARNTRRDCLSARLRLLPALNSGDDLIESVRDGSLAEKFSDLAVADTSFVRTLQSALTALFSRWNIRSLVEVACGHCLWLEADRSGLSHYTGIDLLPELIEHHRRRFSDPAITFSVIDAVDEAIPAGDAVLCLDWLQRLPAEGARALLQRIRDSGARYLIADGHDQVPGSDILSTLLETVSFDGGTSSTLNIWQLQRT